MSELTGPDLALAVAKVMGRNVEVLLCDDIGNWMPGSRAPDAIQPDDVLRFPRWRPDLPGAAFDEALEWAAKNMKGLYLEDMAGGTLWECRWWDDSGVEGEDHRTTVCRAIVAWGERQ